MKEFPEFIRNQANKIATASQYTKNIEGYVFDGEDGSQVCFWTVHQTGLTTEHVHDYDEYVMVVQGQITLTMGSKRITLKPGEEYLIKKGVRHGGEAAAGTRSIDVFGGRRAKRVGEL